MALFKFLRNSIGMAPLTERVAGPPTSSNGASSFHLHWQVGPTPAREQDKFVEAKVTLQVLDPPQIAELYFWALQVSFVNDGGSVAAAHFGLQHNPRFPDSAAVNWGGYKSSGGELSGTESSLPSHPNDLNTRDYRWEPGREYEYHIYKNQTQPGRWSGAITDLETSLTTKVRDLYIEADYLTTGIVWSEVFADCDAPSTSVTWSNLRFVTVSEEVVEPKAVTVGYQDFSAGGCGNTNSQHANDSLVQTTNTPRLNSSGTIFRLRQNGSSSEV